MQPSAVPALPGKNLRPHRSHTASRSARSTCARAVARHSRIAHPDAPTHGQRGTNTRALPPNHSQQQVTCFCGCGATLTADAPVQQAAPILAARRRSPLPHGVEKLVPGVVGLSPFFVFFVHFFSTDLERGPGASRARLGEGRAPVPTGRAPVMSGQAAKEIGAQMASVQEELQSAAAGMSAPTVMVPGGMTRAEFKEWKAAQTEKAKARLKDLEERLQRLQLLETKMQRLKTSSNDAIDAVPDDWTLPGTADNGYGAADELARCARPSALLVVASALVRHALSD